MKSISANKGLRPNGLAPGKQTYTSEKGRINLLEDQVAKLQEDLGILNSQVDNFGSSFNTASASITTLASDNINLKETLESKMINTKAIRNKLELRGYHREERSKATDVSLGTLIGKNADFDVIAVQGNTIQYAKVSMLNGNIISRADSDVLFDKVILHKKEHRTEVILHKAPAAQGKVTYYMHIKADKYSQDTGMTDYTEEKEIPMGNKIVVTGTLDIENQSPLSFENVTIDELTTRIANLPTITSSDITTDNITATNSNVSIATNDTMSANNATIDEVTNTNMTSDKLVVGEVDSENIYNTGKVESDEIVAHIKFNNEGEFFTHNVVLDNSYQLPEIDGVSTTSSVFHFKSGILVLEILNLEEVVGSMIVIKNASGVNTRTSTFINFSQKELNTFLKVEEDKDHNFIFVTKASGLTVKYGVSGNEDTTVETYTDRVDAEDPLKYDITKYSHMIVLGDHTTDYGIVVNGEVVADSLPIPGTSSFVDVEISNTLQVGGKTTLHETHILDDLTVDNDNIDVDSTNQIIMTSPFINLEGKTKLEGDTEVIGENISIKSSNGQVQLGDTKVDKDLSVVGKTTTNDLQSNSGNITTIVGNNATINKGTFEDLTVNNVDNTANIGPTQINGTLTVTGDIIQSGKPYETHAEEVYSKKDIIITRDGATKGMDDGVLTGIKAHLYDGTTDGMLGFDNQGEARVGNVGDEEPLATRDERENLTNNEILVWDDAKHRLVNPKDGIATLNGDQVATIHSPVEKSIIHTARSLQLSAPSDDLNDYCGKEYWGTVWFAGGGNEIKNKPEGVDAFSLEILQSAAGATTQRVTGSTLNESIIFTRTSQDSISDHFHPWKKELWVLENTTLENRQTLRADEDGKLVPGEAFFISSKQGFEDTKAYLPDKTIVNITDDALTGGLHVATTVTQGNQNPVTSDAVYKALNANLDQRIFDLVMPVHKRILQLPGEASPMTLYNNANIHSTWVEKTDDYKNYPFLKLRKTTDPEAESLPNHSHHYSTANAQWVKGFIGSQYDVYGASNTNRETTKVNKMYNSSGDAIENTVYKDDAHVTPANTGIRLWERTN